MKKITFVFLFASSVLLSCGQDSTPKSPGFVEYNSIIAPIHKANIGRLVFTSEVIPVEDYSESNFLSSHEVKEDSELLMVGFLGNSLTNYLHELDTSLTADQLARNGNYQLSFYIDGELLYTENVNKGAGSPGYKNINTVLRVPLISQVYTDYWSRYTWMRFYYRHGGEAALEDGSRTLKIEIRPYLNYEKVIVGDIIAQGEITIKMSQPIEVSEQQAAVQKIESGSGWELSNERYDKDKIMELNKKIIQRRFKDITSIVVVKNGKLLMEEYFNGADRTTKHNTRSVGKSFASTMAGIAIEEGHLKDINQTLNEFYDLKKYKNYSAEKGQVTLKSLLTMSSGFDGSDDNYDSPGHEEKMYPTGNWVKFTLDLAMDSTKTIGENWDYFTAGVVLLGDILDKSVPDGLEKYAHEKLFKPLGITDYQWQYTPQKVVNTAGGIQLRALDFAKYGQLYKNNGTWKGNTVLTPKWTSMSFTNYFEDQPYGFLFWNDTYQVGDESYEVFLCNGNGGNKVIMFKDQPLVIVITATAYNRAYAHSQVNRMLVSYILPSVLDK